MLLRSDQTAEKLDYETKNEYTVVEVTATDPSGATDGDGDRHGHDVDDKPVIDRGRRRVMYAENGEEPYATASPRPTRTGDVTPSRGRWTEDVDKGISRSSSDDGVLTFGPAQLRGADGRRRRQRKGDNVYKVTAVTANGGEHVRSR